MNSVVPFSLVGQLSLKQAAIDYARLGLRVFPVKDQEKKPRINAWQKQATTSKTQIVGWWLRWPNANIGIATGTESGVFVVDVDAKNNGSESLGRLFDENEAFPTTAKQQTGNGEHYLFKCDSAIRNSVGSVAEGIDIRGNGGYIVAAPSIHPNGSRYQWVIEPRSIAQAPEWLLSLLNSKKADPVNRDAAISTGNRNDTLFKIGCSLRKEGKRASEIGAELFRINEYQCELPLPESEISKIISNVNQYLNSEKKPLFQYRDFIRYELPKNSTLRHILHCISFYMDEKGKPAYPTEEQLATDTGLSRATIIAKLKIAEEEGYILRRKNRTLGSNRFNYVYMLPKRFMCKSQATKCA